MSKPRSLAIGVPRKISEFRRISRRGLPRSRPTLGSELPFQSIGTPWRSVAAGGELVEPILAPERSVAIGLDVLGSAIGLDDARLDVVGELRFQHLAQL